MLEVGRDRAIRGNDGPLVVQSASVVIAEGDHRLDGDRHALGQPWPSTRLIETPTLDVFGDKSVVIHQAPGHTPGHTILEVKLKGAGTVLLTGDLWHLAESRAAKRVPRFNVDKAATLKSYEATEALAARTKARVVREHVMEDFEAMPKFPAALN